MNLIHYLLDQDVDFSAIFDSFSEGVVIVNHESQVVFYNNISKNHFKEFFQEGTNLWSKEIGLYHLNNSVLLTREELPLMRALKGEKVQDHHVFFRKDPEAEGIFLSINANPLKNSQGKIQGAIATYKDVTSTLTREKRLLEDRIKSINASKLAAIGSVAAEIGHEINNPLGIISASIMVTRNMLEDAEPLDGVFRQLNIMDSTMSRINEIVSALKYISRDSNKEVFSHCTLEDILNDVLAMSRTKFKIKNVNLGVEYLNVDLSQKIHCLRVQISQVLFNLLINSIDAVASIKDPMVRIKISETTCHFILKVLDNGKGISPEVEARLFEPFFTTKNLGEGSGLGLSVSKGIMLRHKGDIYLDKTEEMTCFTLTIPK